MVQVRKGSSLEVFYNVHSLNFPERSTWLAAYEKEIKPQIYRQFFLSELVVNGS